MVLQVEDVKALDDANGSLTLLGSLLFLSKLYSLESASIV